MAGANIRLQAFLFCGVVPFGLFCQSKRAFPFIFFLNILGKVKIITLYILSLCSQILLAESESSGGESQLDGA